MISKINRFHGHNSLNAVYKHGRAVSGTNLSVKYLASRPNRRCRVAVVVSRKVNKSAVVRNRIRRRIYENMRKYMELTARPYDIVINVYSDQLATMPADELQEMLLGLLEKADLIDASNHLLHAIVNGQEETK